MSEDVFARLKAGKQAQAAAAEVAKTKKVVAAQPVQKQESFAISEAQIKANPTYAILTDEKLTDEAKYEKLVALKVYNSTLSEAENEKNRQSVNEFLWYLENQLKSASQKGMEFTNDEAFSLYDAAVRELFGNIAIFKGYIQPFLKALEVLTKARDAGISANELIEAVSKMRGDISQMQVDKDGKTAELQTLKNEIVTINGESSRLSSRLESLNSNIEHFRDQKVLAEKSWNIFGKGKQIADAQFEIDRYQKQIDAALSEAKNLNDRLAATTANVGAAEAALVDFDAKIAAAQAEFDANEDSQAIATLIEITGDDFKNKREEVVTAAQTIVERSVSKIESSIGRFASGKNEARSQLNVITNLGDMVGLLSTVDKKVRVVDGDFIQQQKAIIDRIKEAKGKDAIYDPDYEIAMKHFNAANEHISEVTSTASRTATLEGKLINQSGAFKSLRDSYSQKELDANNLRTSAAVDIPAQLAIVVKSVEMATATESNNMVNDAFADLSRTTQQSVTSVFDILSHSTGHNNEQLRKTMESTLQTINMMNEVEADLRKKTQENYEVRQSLDVAQQALKDVTSTVASAVVDEENKAMAAATAE
ncbi:amidohydrolase [Rhizobium sp. MHM7A]|uniref:amidohydrolase n=1 Tax=Rhizobium sp. MHM7A TaxID=2583233 RepID=UPI00110724DE|nr:amidohydrolase [Rhizobium sp. MHM7A]TLX16772.1 amidohydrolase [Rhizobium sp. MHM7A]